MSPVHRSPPPSDPPLSDATFDEQSEVRPRLESAAPAPALAESRAVRIARKLRIAKVLLADLPALDDRARLLRIAIVRHDEVLLDGILGALQAQRPPTPIGALASQIARRRHSSGIRPAYQASDEPLPPAAQAEGPARSNTVLPPPRRRDDED